MPRKIIVNVTDESTTRVVLLQEVKAKDEYELQELVKANPDLLPIEEFGMVGPLLVVGRETGLPSGAVDLAALARTGEILIVEFKTGPQNSDFRSALSQLVDYGSDLWKMSAETFESTVPLRFFRSKDCTDPRLQRSTTLDAAMQAIWPDVSDEEIVQIRDRIARQLEKGSFHYVLVAQRFTKTIERTAEYMNAISRHASFYAVELVRFAGNNVVAFETRTVLAAKPPSSEKTDEATLLDKFPETGFRDVVHRLLEACTSMGYELYWGTTGVAVKLPVPELPGVTVAWIFPPDGSGWYSLRNLTLGFGKWLYDDAGSAQGALDKYLIGVKGLPGALPVPGKGLKDVAFTFSRTEAVSNEPAYIDLLTALIKQVNESE